MRAAVFVAVSVGVTAAVVAWFLVSTKRLKDVLERHPDAHPDTPAERFYGPHPSVPAGPDAESQRPEDTGNAWDPPPPPAPTGGRRGPTAPGVAITTHTIGHQVVVHPCGELDVDTDPLLRRRLAELVEIGALDVVVDLSEVRFLGVEAVRVLLDAHQWLVDRGGRLRLSSPSPTARRLFELTGAAEVLGSNTTS